MIEDSAAAAAGLQAGDVVLDIDGDAVRDYSSLLVKIRSAGPGSDLVLKVRRNGAELFQAVRPDSTPK